VQRNCVPDSLVVTTMRARSHLPGNGAMAKDTPGILAACAVGLKNDMMTED